MGSGRAMHPDLLRKDTLLPSEWGDVPESDELGSFVGSQAQTLWLW